MNTSCDLGAWGKPGNPGSQLCAGSAENQPSYLVRNHPECAPPRFRWHLGCILLKTRAISLRTGLAWDGPQGPSMTSLVDLGIPEAREYTVAYLTDVIGSWDLDTFRIESSCNGGHDCLAFFQDHDRTYQASRHPGVPRNGTTEIGHTAGLHAVFDEIRQVIPPVSSPFTRFRSYHAHFSPALPHFLRVSPS